MTHEAPRKSFDGISHGRGGAGNIGADSTPYVDGEIVREGPVGDQGTGPFSTGRGGTGNVGSPGMKPTLRNDQDIIPEVAIRPSQDNAHVGRGGAGNVHHGLPAAEKEPKGLAEKLKEKLFKKST